MAQASELGAVGGEDLSEEEKVEEFWEQAKQVEKEDVHIALSKAKKALKLVLKMQSKNSAKYKEIRAYIKELQCKAIHDESDDDEQDHESGSPSFKGLVRRLLPRRLNTFNADESLYLAKNKYKEDGHLLVKENKYAEAAQQFASAIYHQITANASHDLILDNSWSLVEAVMQDGRLQEAQKLLQAALEYFSPLISPVWKLRMLYLLACLSALLGDRDKEYQCYKEIAGMLKIRTGFHISGEAFLCAAVSVAYRNRDVDLSLEFQKRATTYDNRVDEISRAEGIDRFLHSFERIEESRRTSGISSMLRCIEVYLPRRPDAVPDSSIDQRTHSWTTPAADQSSLPSSHEEQLRSNVADGGIRQPAPVFPSTEAGNLMDDLKNSEEDQRLPVNRPIQEFSERDGTENANIHLENRMQTSPTREEALPGLARNLTELAHLLSAHRGYEMEDVAAKISEKTDLPNSEVATEGQISHKKPSTVVEDEIEKVEGPVMAHSDEKIEEINQDAGATERMMVESLPIPQPSSIIEKTARSGDENVSETTVQPSSTVAIERQDFLVKPSTVAQDDLKKNKTDVLVESFVNTPQVVEADQKDAPRQSEHDRAHLDEKIGEINQDAGAAESIMVKHLPMAQPSSIIEKTARSGDEDVSKTTGQPSSRVAIEQQDFLVKPSTVVQDELKKKKTDVLVEGFVNTPQVVEADQKDAPRRSEHDRAHSDDKIGEINQDAGAAERMMGERLPITQSSSITRKKSRSGDEHPPLTVQNYPHNVNDQTLYSNLGESVRFAIKCLKQLELAQQLRIFSDLEMQKLMAQVCGFIDSWDRTAESLVTLESLQDALNGLNDSLAMGGSVKAAEADSRWEEAQKPTAEVEREASKIAVSKTLVSIPEEKPQKEIDVNVDKLQQPLPVAAEKSKSADDGERHAGPSGNFGNFHPVTEISTNNSERLQSGHQFKEEVHSLQTEMKKLSRKLRNPQHQEIAAMVTDYSITDESVTTTETMTASINEFTALVGTVRRKLQEAVRTPNDDSDGLKQAINLLDQTERRIGGVSMPQN